MVFYPISHPDPATGLSMINWIAEVTMDNNEGWKQSGWFRPVETEAFAHHFDGWVWDWLDVPALIRQADGAFENPMIDRDPVNTWRDGPVALLGDVREQQLGLVAVHVRKSWHVTIVSDRSAHPLLTFGAKICS